MIRLARQVRREEKYKKVAPLSSHQVVTLLSAVGSRHAYGGSLYFSVTCHMSLIASSAFKAITGSTNPKPQEAS